MFQCANTSTSTVHDPCPDAFGPPARLAAVPALIAAGVVFVTSATVLMIEILAGRLLAPYVGVTLETYTAVIGTVLAGIAAGAWTGGFLADRLDPRRLLGPVVVAGGALAILSVPIVRALGDAGVTDVGTATVGLAVAAFLLPALVLSAVTPTVVKLQLRDLDHTGAVVGRLSGIGTLGALVGTFLTGFVLVADFPTKPIVFAVGGALVTMGVALWVWLSRRDRVVVGVLLTAAIAATALAVGADDPCAIESAYSCLRVTRDLDRPGGRILWINRDEHSYVDLDDPTHLEFDYTRAIAAVAAVAWPGTLPLESLHIGGGGFTMPRYFDLVRPGSRSTVLEVDPAVVRIAERDLDLHTSPQLRVRVGDARVGIRKVRAASMDLAVGDAFSDLSVPWHLTTREFNAAIDRALRPGGVYAMNVIDNSRLRFLRAELATLRDRFEWVAAISAPSTFNRGFADNIVLAASHRTLDTTELRQRLRPEGLVLLVGPALDRFVGDTRILTDDYAPVDQWLSEGH
jgi:hypothetical protein